jgi:hypothetical protein
VAHDRLLARMQALVALPLKQMKQDELRQRIDAIGALEGATVEALRTKT